MEENKKFLNVDDVCKIMECSASKSYEIIRLLNAELKEHGFLVMAGKVSAKYFYERIYDGRKEEIVTNGK